MSELAGLEEERKAYQEQVSLLYSRAKLQR